MELVNQEPLDAQVSVSEAAGLPFRLGVVTAKVTYRFSLDGRVEVDTQDPYPLFAQDVSTPLGAMPEDMSVRRSPHFEVIVLGCAHSPDGAARPWVDVALTLGDARRELRATGDRVWHGDTPSPPRPFTMMPLTWDRAFGGSAELDVDAHTVVDVRDPWNHHGRGADLHATALETARALGTPPGYPRVRYERWLPNLDSAAQRVAHPSDVREPVCWATVPDDIGYRAIRAKRDAIADKPIDRDEQLLRAHPDWTLPAAPRGGSPVTLEGLVAGAPSVRFAWPEEQVWADYVVDGRVGQRMLVPQRAVMLPEERRFYVLHRHTFTVEHPGEHERSMRLRLAAPRVHAWREDRT